MNASSPAVPLTSAQSGVAAIPWQLWSVALGVASRLIGVYWDISWHQSIGRDTFWSPPHLAIYACGVLGGIACTSLIAQHTFGPRTSGAVVRILGLRAPLGAFVIGWGGLAMLASAPFDDWWHGAYGLDAKLLSPPHSLLFLGSLLVDVGALLLVLSERNRADGERRRPLTLLYLGIGGLMLTGLTVLFSQYFTRSFMHSGLFYRMVACAPPLALALVAASSRHRFARTIAALVYTGLTAAMVWILPLFAATPKLGPVLFPVTRFVPPDFPILLVAPALALDLLAPRLAHYRELTRAAVLGAVFVAALFLVQWPFADFLQSEHARNAIFATHLLPYGTHLDSYDARFLFAPIEKTSTRFVLNLVLAVVVAGLSTRLGTAAGNWMLRVRR